MDEFDRSAAPVIISKGQAEPRATEVLRRVALSDRTILEKELQQLVFEHPSILPVNAIEQAFAPLIPLGREIQTSVGAIDVAFISPRGFVTLVETKLWRNPQARREVVSQVMDYATVLHRLSVEEFVQAIQRAAKLPAGAGALYEFVRQRAGPDQVPPEQVFFDQLSKGLQNARFLLLVVGDGIDEDVEGLVKFLPQHPQLQFTLALVELVIYKLDGAGDRLLVVPRVTARTREVERVVVKFVGLDLPPSVEVSGPSAAAQDPSRRRTLSEEDFLDELVGSAGPAARAPAEDLMAFLDKLDVQVRFRQSSFAARLVDPKGSAQKLSLFYVDTDGFIVFGWMRDQQLPDLGVPSSFADEYYDAIAAGYGLKRDKSNYPKGLTLNLYSQNPEALRQATRTFVEKLRRLA